MRRAALAGLLGALGALGALGCTPAAIPPAVVEADATLQRRDVRLVAVQRPKLVAEATALAQRAREAAERGESEQATLLARQALQKVQTARNFAARETAERGVAALERAQRAPGRPKPDPARVSVPATPTAPGAPPERDGTLRALAERALVRLALRRSELLGQLRDQTCGGPYREFEAVFELAQRRFDAGDHEGAYELAIRAQERLRACDGGLTQPATAPLATAPPSPRREADDEPARRKAAAALQKAQVELARARSASADDPAVGHAEALLAAADTWYLRRSYAETVELAGRATALLTRARPAPADSAREAADAALRDARVARDGCPDGEAKSSGLTELAAAERAWSSRAYGDAAEHAKRAAGVFRDAALCARARSEVQRGLHATAGEEPTARHVALFRRAEARLQAGACAEALTLAGEAARAVPATAPAASPERAATAPDDAMKRASAFVDERLAQVPPIPGFEPTWRDAYRAVFLASALRDQGEQTSPHLRGPLAEADALLLRARRAWDRRAYASAAQLAEEARRLVAPLAAPPPDAGTPEALARARRRAQWALRAAADLVTACESARCSARAGRRADVAPPLLAAAHAALGDGRYAASLELAKGAELHLVAALRAPLAARAATEPPRASSAEVDRALEAAEVAKVTCDGQRCDPAVASRGRVALGLALASRADGRLDDALREAERAAQRLRFAAIPPFEVPVQVHGLKREGTQLVLTPPLAWKPYSTELVAASEPSVAALARTLTDNHAALRRVRLVVRHAAGSAATLALGRAQRLRAALVARGVPDALVEGEAAVATKSAPPYEIELELADGAP